jgi:Icc-related predicted phosphoesterase
MAGTESVKTRILVLSDTHSALPFPTSEQRPYRWPLPKADVLLHAGDLTGNGQLAQHQRALELIRGVEAELKIIIPGNHDLTLHHEYYHQYPYEHGPEPKYDDKTLQAIQDLYTGEEARATGIVYMVEGVRTFTLSSGATFTVYASAWQPEFFNWAFGYPRMQDRFNSSPPEATFQAPNPVPDNRIDIILTHGPPYRILDETIRDEQVGCEHLRRAVERSKPRLHVFGHIHEAWGAMRKNWTKEERDEDVRMKTPSRKELVERMGAYLDATGLVAGKETLFVNASIMNVRYDPLHAPWVVDLMLPRDTSGVES